MSERDEMRRLIDVIERGANSASVTQNIEDIKLFANAASAMVNKLDAKVTAANQARRKKADKQLPIPKPTKPLSTAPSVPAAVDAATVAEPQSSLRTQGIDAAGPRVL